VLGVGSVRSAAPSGNKRDHKADLRRSFDAHGVQPAAGGAEHGDEIATQIDLDLDLDIAYRAAPDLHDLVAELTNVLRAGWGR